MRRFTRPLAAVLGLLGACGLIAVSAATVGAKSSGRPASSTAYVSITHTAGGYQYAAGNFTDKVIGNWAVIYKIKLCAGGNGTITVMVPSVTIYTATGSLSGTASATLSSTVTTQTISHGRLNLTKGTGGLTGHSFVGTFSGTGNLSTNQFVFHDMGTYK